MCKLYIKYPAEPVEQPRAKIKRVLQDSKMHKKVNVVSFVLLVCWSSSHNSLLNKNIENPEITANLKAVIVIWWFIQLQEHWTGCRSIEPTAAVLRRFTEKKGCILAVVEVKRSCRPAEPPPQHLYFLCCSIKKSM